MRSRTRLLANAALVAAMLAAAVYLFPGFRHSHPDTGTALLWLALLARSAETLYLRRSLRSRRPTDAGDGGRGEQACG